MALNTILCPVNLSPSSNAVLTYASFFAHGMHARLRILHVMGAGAPLSTARTLLQQSYEQCVPAEIQQSLEVETVTLTGDVAEQIAAATEDSSVDIVVMGFRRRPPLPRHLLDRVLDQVRKPVLALPDAATAPPAGWKAIVAATGLDAESSATHALAGALAEMAGAKLTVVHVIQDLPPAIMTPEAFPLPSYRDFALEEASRELDHAFPSPTARPAGLILCGGDISSEVVRVAEREHADLLIVGFHAGKRRLFGTIADRVLNHAHCPVLAVPHVVEREVLHAA